jgi:asparagine synthase (glutamine-hydrolysing)
MSAIAGLWNRRSGAPALSDCEAMLDAVQQYGPHDRQVWAQGEIALGRCLYHSVPEDAVDCQPSRFGERYRLVADVRLDNRAEIASCVGAPDRGSDADLLLALLVRFGEAALDLILGDYAFALWDGHERTLLLARDPLGQRPLFYAQTPSGFAFASMPSGLHALGELPRAPNPDRLAEFVALIPMIGRPSQFDKLSRVEPGHVVKIDTEKARTRRYWWPERADLGLRRFEDYQEAFRAELDRAVRTRMRGAGPLIATHLSSGWDSSAVTATASRMCSETRTSLVAFTSVPRPGSEVGAPFSRISNEGSIAACVAAMHPGLEHVLVPGTAASPIAQLDRLFDLYQRPLATLCNQVWLTTIREQARRRGARVILTGEMGNWSISSAPVTLLADLIRERRWRAWWREASAARRLRGARLRGVLANSFAPWMPAPLWKPFRRFSSRPETRAFTALHPARVNQLEAQRNRLELGLAQWPKDNFEESRRRISQYDFGEWRKGTLAGWGVDERDPTADRRLIEFCLSLPVDMLLKDGHRRPLARAALADRLPPQVLDEKSKGYQAADWHEGLTRHLGEVRELIEQIGRHEIAARIVDVPALRGLVATWPQQGWEDPVVMARYRVALLVALSAGHFAMRSSG